MATNRPNSTSGGTALITVVLAVAVLYFAREVFIPLALAILFAFLLGPLVLRLRHWGFGRVTSVICVVTSAFLLLVVIGGLMTVQLADFGRQLPEYQKNIREKLHSLRDSSDGVLGRMTRVLHDINDELNPPAPATSAPNAEKPVPVEIRQTPSTALQVVQSIIGSLVGVLITTAVVVVFVIFMLLQREDLRDRFIRLVGPRQMNATTSALNEAAKRVSRYLVAQFIVNAAFGVPVGIGLFFLGIPNPVLWGVLATLLRYVPYLGIWIAAAMPAAIAFAIDPGWARPVLVLTLYLGVDLLMYNFAEPLLYGSSTGLTPLAILVAAVFWTWLWGPVGLLLATPLTVCVAVIGRYAPSLQFLGILLGDDPVLSPERRFYQRLLAMDLEEATDVAETFLKEKKSLEDLYDGVILPALSLAEADRHCGRLDEEHAQFILQNTRFIAEDLAERADELTDESSVGGKPAALSANGRAKAELMEADVLSLPARDEADEIGALMLTLLLNQRGISARAISASALASERLEAAGRSGTRVVCVSAVPPFGYLHARYLCKRLRSQYPQVKVVAAILNQGDAQSMKKREPQIPANEAATSLRQAVAAVLALIPARREPVELVTTGS